MLDLHPSVYAVLSAKPCHFVTPPFMRCRQVPHLFPFRAHSIQKVASCLVVLGTIVATHLHIVCASFHLSVGLKCPDTFLSGNDADWFTRWLFTGNICQLLLRLTTEHFILNTSKRKC